MSRTLPFAYLEKIEGSLKSVNKDYIRDKFGLRGLFEAEKLIESEVIKLEGAEYKLNDDTAIF